MNNHLLVAVLKKLYPGECSRDLVCHLKCTENSKPEIIDDVLVGYRGCEYYFEFCSKVFAFVTPWHNSYNEVYDKCIPDEDKMKEACEKRPFVCVLDLDSAASYDVNTIITYNVKTIGKPEETDLTVEIKTSDENKNDERIKEAVEKKAERIANIIRVNCESS